MNYDAIKNTYDELSRDLRIALSSMARKDEIYEIRSKLLNLQNSCDHLSNYTIVDGYCPCCGKKIY